MPTFTSTKLTQIVPLFALLVLPYCAVTAAPSEDAALIKIDGSSTVYPITEAVAEDYRGVDSKIKITVGISGTGGGFKKFCAGETDISNASRPIKAAEIELCKGKSIEYIELPIAYDALSVVINPKNTWATTMTVAELKKLWEPEAQGKITKWNQVRPEWPDKPLVLYGAGVDSGTYDYFTEAVVGKEHSSRGDFTSSEDDNVLVQGVANDINALGFFGLAYYEENQSKLKAVAIDDQNAENGAGAQMPTKQTVLAATYRPLSRPLFIYARKDALEQKAPVKKFVSYYLQNAAKLTEEVGYVQLPKEVYALATKRFDSLQTGSMYASGASQVNTTLADLMKKS